MRWYWAKIGLTALVIFCVGYAGISVFRIGRREVVNAVESNGDITIPLPFIPFNFDGAKLGNFRKVVLHRTSPESVKSVEVTVRVADPALLAKFANCQLTVDDPTRLNEHSSFRCAVADSSMESFGSVLVQTKNADGNWEPAATIPLMLPKSVAGQIRGKDAKSHAAELEADRFRQIGDSLRKLGRMMGRARSDSAREEIQNRMQDLQDEMSQLRESIVEAAADRAASVKVGSGGVTVDVPATPDHPATKIRAGSGGVVVEAPPAPKAPAKPPR